MATLTLTAQQLEIIVADMEEKELLNDAEINSLAQKVNFLINIPLLDEEKELIVFAKIIKFIDRQLYQLLPNEIYKMVRDAGDGISKEEAAELERRLTPMINNVINIPILTEEQEAKLISLVLGIIINAMIKGFKLEEKIPQ